MAGKVRHLVNRNGRYFARLVVPKDLRGIVGKSELREALGGDYRNALQKHPSAVAKLQLEIRQAERKAGVGGNETVRYPLTNNQIAYTHYMQRLAFDSELRNESRYASVMIDDVLVNQLRLAKAGRLNDQDLNEVIGREVQIFQRRGNLKPKLDLDEWRKIARVLCVAEYEALERMAERDEGDFSGEPIASEIVNAEPIETREKFVSLSKLWRDYVQSRIQAGFMKDDGRRQAPVIKGLAEFLKHDNAAKISKKDIINWRDHLLKTKSAKTVSDVELSTVRTLFRWAVDEDLLPENVAANVKQPKPRKVHSRERGYTDPEAVFVLKTSRHYMPTAYKNGQSREKPTMTAAKRWVPILCAFSGARISEMTQLRKEDIRKEQGHWIARITPDAGTVKAGGFRDIPLHPQIVEEGFIDFVSDANDGPLFHGAIGPRDFRQKSQQTAGQLRDWLRERKITPEGVQPNHAWRHRLKTQTREIGISDHVIDSIQGHVGRTASDNYGDVTLKTKNDAIGRLPEYKLR